VYSKQEDYLAKITINNNGSIRVEGEFTICDANGSTFDLSGRTAIGLCRCGHSENKPFCDGNHRKVSFQSEVKARTLPPPVPKPT
jgi:CDGSH-type Zn-finger protein